MCSRSLLLTNKNPDLQIFSPMTKNNQECGLKLLFKYLNYVLRVVSSQELQFLVNTKRTVLVYFPGATGTSIYILENIKGFLK
jgi:hypothetical protein